MSWWRRFAGWNRWGKINRNPSEIRRPGAGFKPAPTRWLRRPDVSWVKDYSPLPFRLLALRAKLGGEVDEVFGDDVEGRIWRGIRSAIGSVFAGARDEGGAETDFG